MSDAFISVSTVAGSLREGHRDGSRNDALFYNPVGLAFTNSGDIIVADNSNHCIRKVTLREGNDISSHVETIAGVAGRPGYRDGTADQALFYKPTSVAVGVDDTIYVTDLGNKRIRTVDGCGKVSTLAGSGKPGFVDGQRTSASFTALYNITSSANKSIFYISDEQFVRTMDVHGIVTTITEQRKLLKSIFFGKSKFGCLCQVACRGGDHETLYVADCSKHAVTSVSLNTGDLRTIAGGKRASEAALLNYPVGICVDISGYIFVCDGRNHKIEIISPTLETMTTLVGCGENGLVDGNGEETKLSNPRRLLLDESTHTLYFTQDHCIRKVDLQHLLPPLTQVSSLSEDLVSLVDNKDLADVVFQVEGKQIYAYKPILSARCSYFSCLFSSKESHLSRDRHMTTIPIEDVSFDAFQTLIVYLMTDKVNVDMNDWKMVCQLLILSDHFLVSKLKSYCETTLARQIRVENVVEILVLADTQNIPMLKKQAITFICKHRAVMVDRDEMKKLSPSLLFEIMPKGL